MPNILVIDDDSDIRTMLRLMLENGDHNVILARNGREGIQKFHEQQPDLVITDIYMPEMEGIETITRIRRDYPGTKIIAISGRGGIEGSKITEFLPFAKKLGAIATIRKPFLYTELMYLVDEVIRANDISQLETLS